MNDYERVSKLIIDYGSLGRGNQGLLELGSLIGTWEPAVEIHRHYTTEIEMQLYARDARSKSYLLTKEDALYKSSNRRILKANEDDRKWLMNYLGELVKEEEYEW